MTKLQLAERTRLIRKTILNINQEELAEKLGSSQSLVSRFEASGNGTMELLIALIDYYQKKGINTDLLFLPEFDIKNIMTVSDRLIKETTTEILRIVESINKDLQVVETAKQDLKHIETKVNSLFAAG